MAELQRSSSVVALIDGPRTYEGGDLAADGVWDVALIDAGSDRIFLTGGDGDDLGEPVRAEQLHLFDVLLLHGNKTGIAAQACLEAGLDRGS